MSTEAAAFVRSWKVGHRTCTLSVPAIRPGDRLSAVTEWSPTQPRAMTELEIDQYIRGRNRALRDLAAELHISVAVVDL